MIAENEIPIPVRLANWLKQHRANWRRARAILSTTPALTFEPSGNVVLLQKVQPEHVATFMDSQYAATGRRPSHAEAAEHFNVHRTTISRAMQKVA